MIHDVQDLGGEWVLGGAWRDRSADWQQQQQRSSSTSRVERLADEWFDWREGGKKATG